MPSQLQHKQKEGPGNEAQEASAAMREFEGAGLAGLTQNDSGMWGQDPHSTQSRKVEGLDTSRIF